MIRMAVIADIHGNMPALEAVIDDLEHQSVDEVLVAGDLVGRGPQGSRVVKRIRELGWPTIAGNHEEYLLGFRRGEIPERWKTAEEWAAGRWMAAELDEDDATHLESLPFSLERPGLKVVHGTPTTNRDGIGPWTRDAELQSHLQHVEERVLVCAHIHRPMIRELAGVLVVNVGAVGLPFNRDHRAQYAIFSSGGEYGWDVELRQVPYDLTRIFEICESTGFLAEGGVTARLLRMELEFATPILVPYLDWTKAQNLSPSSAHVDAFLETRRPAKREGMARGTR